LGRISTEINNYVGNNNGTVPDGTASTTTGFVNGFVPRYINGATAASFYSPKTGASMTFSASTTTATTSVAEDTVVYVPSALCNGELPTATGSSRQFAVAIGLEGGAAYCVDNK
jgi:hypothetical protein